MPSMPDAERSSLRILCLLDFPTGGSRWLWEYQDEPRDEVDFEISQPIPWLRRISRSLAYIGENGLQAVRAYRRQRRKTYDLVVAWEIKNGLFFAFLRRLFGRRSPKFVILAFAYRGASRRSPGLFKSALKSVAAISVPSQEEATLYASRLDYPVENIHLCPNGAYDLGLLNKLAEQPAANSLEGSEQVVSIHDQPVIFSGGYSHRDFGTLLAAVEGLPARCLLVTPSLDRENAALSPNVEWILQLSRAEYARQLAAADIVAIPLTAQEYATGLSDLLLAMSAGRAIVITRSTGIEQYVQHQDSALLVAPGSVQELRAALEFLLANAEERRRLGTNARQRYQAEFTMRAFTQRVFSILNETALS